MNRVRCGLAVIPIGVVLLSSAPLPCMAGVQSLVCKAGIVVTEINSGISDTNAVTNATLAAASASANGVSGTSTMSLQGSDGRTFQLCLSITRTVNTGARPSVAYDTADTTNRFVMRVLSTNTITLYYSWDFTRTGDCFAMPQVNLHTPSGSRLVFDPYTSSLTGSSNLTLTGSSGPLLVELRAGGSLYASVPAASDDFDSYDGTVTLTFDFPPELPPFTSISVEGQDLVVGLGASSLGQTNRIEFSTNLLASGWTFLTNVVSDGSSCTASIPLAGLESFRAIRCVPAAP